jgi:hypothetical protein
MDGLRIIAPATHRNFPRDAMRAAKASAGLKIFYPHLAHSRSTKIFFFITGRIFSLVIQHTMSDSAIFNVICR